MTPQPFQPEHLAQIAEAFAAGRPLLCPVCNVPLMALNVNQGKQHLAIEWLVGCARCRRTVFAKDIAPRQATRAAPDEKIVGPPAQEGRPTVLVVDDQPDFRLSMRQLLEALGYWVLEAKEGAEAYALLQSIPVSILLVDVFMERMSGIELLRQLRLQPGPKPRIVLVTGAAHLGDNFTGAMGVLFDADAVLLKPFTADQLIAALKGDLPDQVTRNSGPAAPPHPDTRPRTGQPGA
jgi:CheY-like chemotaxis protein